MSSSAKIHNYAVELKPKEEIRVMVLDLGTTNTRVHVYDGLCNSLFYRKVDTQIIKTENKSSEIDPLQLWNNVKSICKDCIEELKLTPKHVTSMAITTQRESFLIWDKYTGSPLMHISSWQDRRAEEICDEMNSVKPFVDYCKEKTNSYSIPIKAKSTNPFLLKPNLSLVRLFWTLKKFPLIKQKMDDKEALFGTVESWIIYNLTKGCHHVSDVASASITGMFDFDNLSWNGRLIDIFKISKFMLPKIINTHGFTIETHPSVFGECIPIHCIIGDQQASTFGCGCHNEGLTKCTLGTGLFIDTFTGPNLISRPNGPSYPLVGWKQLNNDTKYVFETRSDFANTKILTEIKRNSLDITSKPSVSAQDSNSVIDLSDNDRTQYLLKQIAFEFYDAWKNHIHQLQPEYKIDTIRFDGGLSCCDYLLQNISNILNMKVIRLADTDSTSRGAFFLSALTAKVFNQQTDLDSHLKLDLIFQPSHQDHIKLLKEYEEYKSRAYKIT